MKSIRMGIARAVCAALAIGLAPVSAHALDLQTVLSEVAAANPSLAAQRARADAAADGVSPAGAWPSPRLQFGLMNVPTSGNLDQEPMTQQQIAVSQRVPLFGRTGLSRRSATERARAEDAAVQNTHWMLLGHAWTLYADAYAAADRVRIGEGHRGVMSRMVASARARYESGTGRLEDVLRAQSAEAQVLVDIEQFRAQEKLARARLDGLRGVDATQSTMPVLDVPPLASIDASDSAWVDAARQQHPRLRELEAREAGHRYESQALKRRAWPDLDLMFAYGFRKTLFESGKEQDDLWTAAVAFEVPIFAGSREFAEGDRQLALADAASADRRATELDLIAETTAALAEARAAQRTVGLLADTVVVTQRHALDASWSSYTAGITDLWRTLEAAHSLYQEEVRLTRARESLARAEGRLIALTGRGDLLGVELPDAMPSGRQP